MQDVWQRTSQAISLGKLCCDVSLTLDPSTCFIHTQSVFQFADSPPSFLFPPLSYLPSAPLPQDCTWACTSGFYSASGGPCLRCSLFMQSAAAAGLYPPPPAVGGIWNDTDGRCNADSWACAPGFRRSPAGARYCCPLAIPHSSSLSGEGSGPCGVGCDAGFWWNSAAANCSQCDGSLLPANAAWLSTEAANGKVLA